MDMGATLRVLKAPAARPLDLRDLLANYGKWRARFQHALGVLLIVTGLKFPVARGAFCRAYDTCYVESDMVREVFFALQAAAVSLTGHTERMKLHREIDAV